jgi:hypothetical protein
MKIEEGTSNEDFRGRKDVRKIREKMMTTSKTFWCVC